MATKTPSCRGLALWMAWAYSSFVDGLGVQLLAGPTFTFQQDSGVGLCDLLGQGLDLMRGRAPGHDVVKGVPGAVGLVDPAKDLAVSGLHGLQLVPGLVGVLQKGNHRHTPHQFSLLIDGVEVYEVEILHLLPGQVENGPPRLQHIGEPGARPKIPEPEPFDIPHFPPQLPAKEVQIGLIAKDDGPPGIDHRDALLHGVEDIPCGLIQLHVTVSSLLSRALPPRDAMCGRAAVLRLL